MIEENKNKHICYWLLLITSLVALMIVVGGLTRLTDSGLSITKWDLFKGIIPPLSHSKWEFVFSLYKEIPEYKLINSSMTIEEFKTIFWWEYIHRLLGRIIGILYLVPLLFFTFKKYIEKEELYWLYFIFFLISLQGAIGWYMVQSGLTENTDVSHYRLSLHLTLAFIIFILLIWNFLKFSNITNKKNFNKHKTKIIPIFFIVVMIQISIGAFVSGLDAGLIYQSWPLMGENYFPNDSVIADLFTFNLFNSPSLVQFIHRNIAYLIIAIFLIMLIIIFTNNNLFYLRKTVLYVSAALLFQIFLGILTILSGAQIYIASLHQTGSIILITFCTILLFKNYKID